MFTPEQMILRFSLALVLGALIGLERELIGKEAGVRTIMLVSGGSAIFAMASLMLPHIAAEGIASGGVLTVTSDFSRIAANIVVGIGFLGAGIIIQTKERVRGLTTAALVWTSASIGMLVGLGEFSFSIVAAVLISVLLYFLRGLNVGDGPHH